MLIFLSPLKINTLDTAASMNTGTINLTWNTSNMKMQGGSGSFDVGDAYLSNNPFNNNTPVFFDNDINDINRMI